MNHYMNSVHKIPDSSRRADHPLFSASPPPIQSTLNALLLTPDSVVVEIGAEAGRFTLPIARYFATKNGNGAVFTYDFSEVAVERNQQKARDAHLNAYVHSDLIKRVKPFRIPMANEEVDVVLSINSAQDNPAAELYYRECLRILRPGGTLFVADRPEARMASDTETASFRLSHEETWSALKRAGAEICKSIDIPGYAWVILVVNPLVELPS